MQLPQKVLKRNKTRNREIELKKRILKEKFTSVRFAWKDTCHIQHGMSIWSLNTKMRSGPKLILMSSLQFFKREIPELKVSFNVRENKEDLLIHLVELKKYSKLLNSLKIEITDLIHYINIWLKSETNIKSSHQRTQTITMNKFSLTTLSKIMNSFLKLRLEKWLLMRFLLYTYSNGQRWQTNHTIVK